LMVALVENSVTVNVTGVSVLTVALQNSRQRTPGETNWMPNLSISTVTVLYLAIIMAVFVIGFGFFYLGAVTEGDNRWLCVQFVLPICHGVLVYLPWLTLAFGGVQCSGGSPWWQHLVYTIAVVLGALACLYSLF